MQRFFFDFLRLPEVRGRSRAECGDTATVTYTPKGLKEPAGLLYRRSGRAAAEPLRTVFSWLASRDFAE